MICGTVYNKIIKTAQHLDLYSLIFETLYRKVCTLLRLCCFRIVKIYCTIPPPPPDDRRPIEKFLEISKDFPYNHCIEKPSKWIFLILCIHRQYSFLISKTLSNFDFGMFYFTSIFPESPTFPHSPHHN